MILVLLLLNLSFSYELHITSINLNNLKPSKLLDPNAGNNIEGFDERFNKTENIQYYNSISTLEHLNPDDVIAKINKNMESKYLLHLLLNKNVHNSVKFDYISKYNHIFDDSNTCDLYNGGLMDDWKFTI